MFYDGIKLSPNRARKMSSRENFELGSEHRPKPKAYNIKSNTFHWIR